ncbi:MAG: STAS/SEC14 domain-containing protein [Candidatus Tantalella remota]|nr:STAS/SEC14 domain-containing protein [Candidatus Tantalella remota]
MINILPESHDNIVGVKASGKVTDADYKDVIIPKLDSVLSEYDKSNFLYYLSDEFEGFELGAMWDDLKYASGHHKKFNKIALVGGNKWVEWSTSVCGHMMNAEIRTFSDDQLSDAWQWVESQ